MESAEKAKPGDPIRQNAEFLRWFNGFVRRNVIQDLTALQRDMVRTALTRKRLFLAPARTAAMNMVLNEVKRMEALIEVELEKYSTPKGEPK